MTSQTTNQGSGGAGQGARPALAQGLWHAGRTLLVMLGLAPLSSCVGPASPPLEPPIPGSGLDPSLRPFIDKEHRKLGFMGPDGTPRLPATFEGVSYFSDGLAPVRQNGRWGFIDPRGRMVIPPRYPLAYPFRDGLALVLLGVKDGRDQQAFIDRRGQVVIGPDRLARCILLDRFSEGLAAAHRWRADHWGFIDRHGEMVLEDEWEGVTPFSGGFAHVFKDGNHRNGLMDRRGRLVLGSRRFLSTYRMVSEPGEGLVSVLLRRTDRWGAVDTSGRMVIEPGFAQLGQFANGLAPAMREEQGKYGYVDRRGRFVIPPRFNTALPFSEGLALVGECAVPAPTCIADRFGYINTRGELVIPLQPWVQARAFSCGLAQITVGQRYDPNTHRSGYLDRTGQIAVRPQFHRASDFAFGLAVVEHLRPDRTVQRCLLDTRGKVLCTDEDSESLFPLYNSERPHLY